MITDTEFELACEKIGELLGRLRAAWDEIIRTAEEVLPVLAGPLQAQLGNAIDRLGGKITEALSRTEEPMTHLGSPGSLRAAGEAWTVQVGGRVSRQAGQLTKGELATDNTWSGPAATRYGDTVVAQGQAFNQAKTITDGLQAALNECAYAIRNFWLAVLIALGVLVTAVLAASVALIVALGATAATGGVAAPAVWAPIGAVIIATVAYLGAVATAMVMYVNKLEDQQSKMDQLAAADAAFPSGSWPAGATDRLTTPAS